MHGCEPTTDLQWRRLIFACLYSGCERGWAEDFNDPGIALRAAAQRCCPSCGGINVRLVVVREPK